VAVARTIRTCSLFALGLALASPAWAKRDAVTPLGYYVQARALDATGQNRDAAIAYSLALSGAPEDGRIALRAFRQAIEAGNKGLALRAAQSLETQGALPQDARLLLFSEALAKGDWRGANRHLDALEGGSGFDFLVPQLRAWTLFASRDGDPVAALDAKSPSVLSTAYNRETRIVMLLAQKRGADASAALKTLSITDPRTTTTRLLAAAGFSAAKNPDAALAILSGDSPAIRAARDLVESGKPVPQAIETAPQGVAFLFARLSGDLLRDGSSPISLTLARLARFADPKSDVIGFALAQALATSGHGEEALVSLDAISGPMATMARDMRVGVLQSLGRDEEALQLAQATIALPNAGLAEYGALAEAYSRADRPVDAAKTYREAVARAGEEAVPWNIWLLYGAAMDSAGDWPGAKAALGKAVALAPDQPAALNHLGYAMLERDDDLAEATRLIAKANVLKPDDPAITDSLGWALYLRGQAEQSIPLLERAVASEPREAALSEHLGDAYWTTGRRVDARYSWKAALVQADGEPAAARIQNKIANGLPARRP
jgi:tetratricopeptide (TPR) repeat protein